MSRLTEKRKYPNGYEYQIEDLYENTADDCVDKLGQLEDLEEQIGCPLDVLFKAIQNGIYIEDKTFNTFEKYDVRGIELIGLSVINKICNYGECDFTCYYDEYKKTWWLKEDKSE